jgi:SAM-dependent methyltransferase
MASLTERDGSTPPAETIDYYRTHARDFFESTVGVDMAPLHAAFLSRLPPGARILDAGCGSGRDARAFAGRGHLVTAFDASAPLARLASEHGGFPVAVRRFDEVEEVAAYEGIWACASLLHVPLAALPDALGRLWRALRPGGCFYLSFQLGQGERTHEGRHFTDADDPTLRAWLRALPAVASVDTWVTRDRRPGRDESWLNALVARSTGLPTG